DLRIPYVATYSYEETLVIGEADAAEEMQDAYTTLASHLARLDRRSALPRSISTSPATRLAGEPGTLAVWDMSPRDKDFVDRAEELARLEVMLRNAGAQAVVVTGLGGIGKTALALEYVQRHREDYQLACWMTATSSEAV